MRILGTQMKTRTTESYSIHTEDIKMSWHIFYTNTKGTIRLKKSASDIAYSLPQVQGPKKN